MADPIPVTTGFSWTAILMAVANLLIGGLLVAIVRTRPALKKIANEREANLLTERAAEMEAMRAAIAALESKLERERVKHEAERALDRHRLNNALQCLDALFLMFETAPERASEVITRVKEMRRTQMEAEAVEKATIMAASIKETGE